MNAKLFQLEQLRLIFLFYNQFKSSVFPYRQNNVKQSCNVLFHNCYYHANLCNFITYNKNKLQLFNFVSIISYKTDHQNDHPLSITIPPNTNIVADPICGENGGQLHTHTVKPLN